MALSSLSPLALGGWVAQQASRLESFVVDDLLVGWNPSRVPSLTGKVALITGSNSGIGFQTARKLAENGCKVYMVSRDPKRGGIAAARIRAEFGKDAQVVEMQCDNCRMKDVLELVGAFKAKEGRLDILVCNSGVFHPGPFAKTPDGLEQTLAINYYAHALLTLGLLDRLRATPGARVVMMASSAEQFGVLDFKNLRGDMYSDSGMTPYGTSKLYMLMFAREMSMRVPEVDFFTVHPGLVNTPLQIKVDRRYWSGTVVAWAAALVGQHEYHGSWSTIYIASAPELAGRGKGLIFIGPNMAGMHHTFQRKPANRAAYSPVSCWRLVEKTAKMLESIVGKEAMPPLPRNPDDVWSK